jgi:hypothetical protein
MLEKLGIISHAIGPIVAYQFNYNCIERTFMVNLVETQKTFATLM